VTSATLVLQLSALKDISALQPYLQGHLSVLAGQSGMGKSTLAECADPQAKRATARNLGSTGFGCHTTTHSQLYHVDAKQRYHRFPEFRNLA